MADAMRAGSDVFFSVLGGMLPVPMSALVIAGHAGDAEGARRLDGMLGPLRDTFKAYGSLRVTILPLQAEARERALAAMEPLLTIG